MQGTLGILVPVEGNKAKPCKAKPMLVVGVSNDRSALPEVIYVAFQKFSQDGLTEWIEQENQVVAGRQTKGSCIGINKENIILPKPCSIISSNFNERPGKFDANDFTKPKPLGGVKTGLALARTEIDEMIEYDIGLFHFIDQLTNRGTSNRLIGHRMRQGCRMNSFQLSIFDIAAAIQMVSSLEYEVLDPTNPHPDLASKRP